MYTYPSLPSPSLCSALRREVTLGLRPISLVSWVFAWPVLVRGQVWSGGRGQALEHALPSISPPVAKSSDDLKPGSAEKWEGEAVFSGLWGPIGIPGMLCGSQWALSVLLVWGCEELPAKLALGAFSDAWCLGVMSREQREASLI